MIKAIFIANKHSDKQVQVDSAQLEKGRGIITDRYFAESKFPGQNITFIEYEEIQNYNTAYNQNIKLSATRRNVVTTGVRLNDLVGKEFNIGDVTFRGIELCEPCAILGGLLENENIKNSEVVKAFTHKGGLRADVLSNGKIATGNTINI